MGKTIHDNSEEFRRITMKVLVMQLFSTTIMDLIAYGGSGNRVAMVILDMQAGLLAPMADCSWCWRLSNSFFPCVLSEAPSMLP